jgi:hypothetical protein
MLSRHVSTAILEMVKALTDNHGRVLSTDFVQLPSKSEFPEYYEAISNPVDLKTISRKIDQHKYLQLKDFQADVSLVWSNAMEFNEPNSRVRY